MFSLAGTASSPTTKGRPLSSELPRLAIIFPPVDLPFLAVVEAGRDVWEPLWVLTGDDRGAYRDARALHRFGTVVDLIGMPIRDAGRRLAHHRPDGIAAFRTEEFAITSLLAKELDLPFHDDATIARLTDKHVQRDAMALAGLPVPRYWSVPGLRCDSRLEQADVDRIISDVSFPVIVKPANGGSSRNVSRVASSAELRKTVGTLLPDEPSGLVIEEILRNGWDRPEHEYGDYLSVESVIVNDVIHHATITGRFPLADPYREVGSFLPGNLDAYDEPAIRDCADRAIRAMGIHTGSTHTEIKLTPDGPRVIEVNGALGGEIPDLIRLSTDQSILTLAGRAALGLHPVSDPPMTSQRISYMWNILPPVDATSLLAVRGYEEAGKIQGVDSIHLRKRPGDKVSWREGTVGYVACVTGTVPSLRHDDLWDVIATLRNLISMDFATESSTVTI